MGSATQDSRYAFARIVPSKGEIAVALKNIPLDRKRPVVTEVFLARAVSGKIEMEVVHKNPGDLVSLPVSAEGKTIVNYVGKKPVLLKTPDQFGNLQVRLSTGVTEVIFNSLTVGARGRNRGPHGKKKIYIVE